MKVGCARARAHALQNTDLTQHDGLALSPSYAQRGQLLIGQVFEVQRIVKNRRFWKLRQRLGRYIQMAAMPAIAEVMSFG